MRSVWLRGLALVLGVVVLLAHVFTLKPIATWFDWLHIDWPDMVKHFTMLSLFTLAYTLSWRRSAHKEGLPSWSAPVWVCIAICSGWGAVCEIIQHWIPARDFNVFELAVNTLTPVMVVLAVTLVRKGVPGLARLMH